MTTTPETPEQIVADALNRLPHEGGGFHTGSAHVVNVVHDLRAAGLLGGDPSEEQIERAAEALAAWDGFEWSGDWEGTVSRDAYRNGATRALTAAAGVAPREVEGMEYVAMRHYELATVMEQQRDELRGVIAQLRGEVDELTRQGHPTGVLLRILAGVAPQEPSYRERMAQAVADLDSIRRECRQADALADQPVLDAEKVAEAIRPYFNTDPEASWGPFSPEDTAAYVLCEAAKRGELT